jgi:hypothetical protein
MDHKYTRDDFGTWLVFLDDYIDDFLAILPPEKRDKLDYLPKSLDVVEMWLLDQYPSNQAREERFKQQEHRHVFMGAMCYVGETIRRNLGGIWNIHLDEQGHPYEELPVIENFDQQGSTLCPAILMSQAIEKRVGVYISAGLLTWMEHTKS